MCYALHKRYLMRGEKTHICKCWSTSNVFTLACDVKFTNVLLCVLTIFKRFILTCTMWNGSKYLHFIWLINHISIQLTVFICTLKIDSNDPAMYLIGALHSNSMDCVDWFTYSVLRYVDWVILFTWNVSVDSRLILCALSFTYVSIMIDFIQNYWRVHIVYPWQWLSWCIAFI